jgi:hypothetical protein
VLIALIVHLLSLNNIFSKANAQKLVFITQRRGPHGQFGMPDARQHFTAGMVFERFGKRGNGIPQILAYLLSVVGRRIAHNRRFLATKPDFYPHMLVRSR